MKSLLFIVFQNIYFETVMDFKMKSHKSILEQ